MEEDAEKQAQRRDRARRTQGVKARRQEREGKQGQHETKTKGRKITKYSQCYDMRMEELRGNQPCTSAVLPRGLGKILALTFEGFNCSD